MTQCLEEGPGIYEYYFTDDPNAMIGVICERMEDIIAISLDHDLFDRAVGGTELTGMMVADFVTTQPPRFPIVLHTSNARDGEKMKRMLREVGWRVRSVTPFDDTTWVGNDWYPTLKKAIRHFADRK